MFLFASMHDKDELAPGHRQRFWLDDLLAALNRCRTGPFAAAYEKLMATPGANTFSGTSSPMPWSFASLARCSWGSVA